MNALKKLDQWRTLNCGEDAIQIDHARCVDPNQASDPKWAARRPFRELAQEGGPRPGVVVVARMPDASLEAVNSHRYRALAMDFDKPR